MKILTVIFKVSEICPLACKYCYFFKGHTDLLNHPPLIDERIIRKLSHFLNEGAKQCNIDGFDIIFHGGEPLMLDIFFFDWMCVYMKENIKNAKVKLNLQTNGVFLNIKWIKLFNKYKIPVGISIDGPERIHNKNRIYKNNLGSYKDVEAAIHLSQKEDLLFGTLSVIDPKNDPKEIYEHLRGLGVTWMDFLFPDCCYDHRPDHSIYEYGKFLCVMFNTWIKEDNPEVNIRILSSMTKVLLGGKSSLQGIGPKKKMEPITVFSNGDLSPADDYCVIGNDVMYTGYNLYQSSLKCLLEHSKFKVLKNARDVLPVECQKCRWKNICLGGDLQHRYCQGSFSKKSIYCQALFMLYSHIESFLISQGVSLDRIEKVL